MKIKILLLLMLGVNFSYAQEGPMKVKRESSFFDLPVENMLGIVDLDINVVAKRLHLKSQSSEYRKLNRIISWYTLKTDSVFSINKAELETIERVYRRNVAAIKNKNNYEEVFGVVKEYSQQVKPYSPAFQVVEIQLGNWVSGFLTQKQFSKWESYLSKRHKEIRTKIPMPMNGPPSEFL